MRNKFATTDSDIALCVNELTDDDGQGSSDWSSEWTKLVSRGGLVHIKDTNYMVFRTMELLVQQYFQMSTAGKMLEGAKSNIISVIKEDEDFQFYWCIACS